MQISTLFEPGQLFITSNAQSQLTNLDVLRGLRRHLNGDWGELCEDDKAENELSLKEQFRLLSAYRSESGTKFWIITEGDRSLTTVLLPEDY